MKHHLRRLPKVLGQLTEEISTANSPGIKAVIKSVTAVTEDSRKPRGKRLKESLKLQKRLRQLTHQVLAAQEHEREKLSHELRDDIAQTLLGINVRLLLLKQAARSKARGLKNEIASAQRLVVKSAKLVRRLAHELDQHKPTQNELKVMCMEAV